MEISTLKSTVDSWAFSGAFDNIRCHKGKNGQVLLTQSIPRSLLSASVGERTDHPTKATAE